MCLSSSEKVGWVCLNIWKKVTYGVLRAGDGLSSYQFLRYHLLGQKDTQRYPFTLLDWIIPVWQPLDNWERTGGTHLEDNHLHKSSLSGRQAGSTLPGVPSEVPLDCQLPPSLPQKDAFFFWGAISGSLLSSRESHFQNTGPRTKIF